MLPMQPCGHINGVLYEVWSRRGDEFVRRQSLILVLSHPEVRAGLRTLIGEHLRGGVTGSRARSKIVTVSPSAILDVLTIEGDGWPGGDLND
jgi:hypothetical protein